jgi:hypothetical protein
MEESGETPPIVERNKFVAEFDSFEEAKEHLEGTIYFVHNEVDYIILRWAVIYDCQEKKILYNWQDRYTVEGDILESYKEV